MGESVTGAACVQATPTDGKTPAALYVVGGTTNGSDGSYNGLQRYTFSNQKWESLSPSSPVTQNRLLHNAVYLNSSSSILVYAGSQDGSSGPSSQTFTISTIPPYMVLAYESSAPPAISPLLMQWSDSEAVMIGGTQDNKKVMIFNPLTAWLDSNITLAQPLKDAAAVKAIVLNCDDKSKHLYTFDLTVSPNQVSRTILINADGSPMTNAGPVVSRTIHSRHFHGELKETDGTIEKRDLTVATWPSYNSTLAPKVTRKDWTIAKDQSGLVVMSGGSTEDVLCMFKARANTWVNATELLVQSPLDNATPAVPSTTITNLSSTQTPLQSSTAPTNDTPPTYSLNPKILGPVLGSIFGFAIIIMLILFFLRARRNRKKYVEAGHQRRASGLPVNEKDTIDYADRGMYFGNQPKGHLGHRQQESQGSFSSMAILMGKVGQSQKKSALGRRNGSNGSDSSSTFNRKFKNEISKPIPQSNFVASPVFSQGGKGVHTHIAAASTPTAVPRPRASGTVRRGSTRRSSGWNRYWSGGSAMNILGFGNKRNTGGSTQSDNRASGSQYSDGGTTTNAAHLTQNSATVPPLNLTRPAGRMSRVASNTPVIAHASSDFPLKDGIAGQLERPGSVSSEGSYDSYRNTVSSGVPSSIHPDHSWTPVGTQGWGEGGAPNVAYTNSAYSTILPRGRPIDNSANSTVPDFPDAPNHRPPLSQVSDMSWLNLGAGQR
jgi:hypothetical protein